MSIVGTQNKDVEIVVRMLYYCSEPRLVSQIKSYCEIDGMQFNEFVDHCINRNLLRKFFSEEGLLSYVVTDHGRKTLATAQDVMKALEIEVEIPENPIQTVQIEA